jgi:hypothetical protein
VRKFVFLEDAPNWRRYCGVVFIGKINRRHCLATAAAPSVVLCVADGIVRIVVHVVAGEDLGGLRRGIDRLISVTAGEEKRCDQDRDAEP